MGTVDKEIPQPIHAYHGLKSKDEENGTRDSCLRVHIALHQSLKNGLIPDHAIREIRTRVFFTNYPEVDVNTLNQNIDDE